MKARVDSRIAGVRHFNRFYTRRIGVLAPSHLDSRFSLTEARVIFEIAHQPEITARNLARSLRLDPGYLSRVLSRLEVEELVAKSPCPDDGRQRLLSLTPSGRDVYEDLDQRADRDVAAMLTALRDRDQTRLLDALQTIEDLLGDRRPDPPVVLRSHRSGDLGWVIHRHGVLYREEYGWGESFEALVAEILAQFVRNFDPRNERSWIAEQGGEIVGSVFVTRASESESQLRLLYVEPCARGLGLGHLLVEECIHFSRARGYEKIRLWTNDVLKSARHIYQKLGFRCVERKPHASFGQELVGETWECALR